MDKFQEGRIQVYPDLEIASINVFTDNLTGLTGILIINMERTIGAICTFVKI